MKLSDILLLLKGKRAAVGEIRNWKGGSYIKTATGWKPHEKQYSKKYTERKNNAATKKDTDLRKRQSEVARLSGEIQGHKAAVEHHTAQNTKHDTRQAKHHSIRAQVKQRRLDKHKEILEQRHGVKDEPVKAFTPNPEAAMKLLKDRGQQFHNIDGIVLNKNPKPQIKFPKKIVDKIKENGGGFALDTNGANNPKDYIYCKSVDEVMKQAFNYDVLSIRLFNFKKSDKGDIYSQYTQLPLIEDAIPENDRYDSKGHLNQSVKDALMDNIEYEFYLREYDPYGKGIGTPREVYTPPETKPKKEKKDNESESYKKMKQEINLANLSANLSMQTGQYIDLTTNGKENAEAKANFEKWKADRQDEKPKETAVKEKKLSQRNSFLKDRYEAGHSLSDIFKELKKDYQRDPATANAIFTDFIKSQKESGNQKLMNEFNGTSFIENIHDTPQYKEMLARHGIDPSDPYKEKEQPKPKENVIQSGSRGATIAGQHFSKREVDILNSLDDIVKRVKSPVVQDLINKRKEANIVIPSKELGQPKLEPHESKFMELVKRNRSQADKQAGYPEERRKVEAETGVKIPKEKAVEMTKHMKASFIWDIKKPSLIR